MFHHSSDSVINYQSKCWGSLISTITRNKKGNRSLFQWTCLSCLHFFCSPPKCHIGIICCWAISFLCFNLQDEGVFLIENGNNKLTICNFLSMTNISLRYHSFSNPSFHEILPVVTVYSANNHKQQLWDHHLLSAVTLPLVMSQPENYSRHNLFRLQPSSYTILHHVDRYPKCMH